MQTTAGKNKKENPVYLLDIITGNITTILNGNYIKAKFIPNKDLFEVENNDNDIYIFSVKTSKIVSEFKGYYQSAISENGKYFIFSDLNSMTEDNMGVIKVIVIKN